MSFEQAFGKKHHEDEDLGEHDGDVFIVAPAAAPDSPLQVLQDEYMQPSSWKNVTE